MKSIVDLDISNKKVLIRCDFNVPIKDGKIVDDTRIKESLKTINYCIEKKAKIILFSHLGRIKTEEDLKDKTLLPVSKRLSKLLGKKVIFINETRGKKLEDAVNKLTPGDVLLVEDTKHNKYFEISVSSDMDDGCSILLTEEQITELTQKIKSSIN